MVSYFRTDIQKRIRRNMTLNKFIAQSGICSRRKAVELIKAGKVTINHKKITTPAYQVKENDVVRVNKKAITPQEYVYILLNKPVDFITTVSDELGRKTILDLIKNATKARVFPVGRLDKETTGLLLLTNDGDLSQQLAHPKFGIQKTYQVTLNKHLDALDLQKIKKGIRLKDGMVKIDEIKKFRNQIKLTLHSGKYRVIRRLFDHLGYKVIKLDRVNYAGLSKRGLKVGLWRLLRKNEIQNLKSIA